MAEPRVRSGLERLLTERIEALRGCRVGLLANPTAILPDLSHALDRLLALPSVQLVRLFGPEHGIRGEAQDMEAVASRRDPETGLEVVSLYGHREETLRPPPGSLADLDVLVYDIQDVGTRFYTFAATLAYCMDAAAAAGVRVVVCDRPNPLGGALTEGAWPIEPACRSFVGALPVAVRHGLTVGELARVHQAVACPGVELEVIELTGWRREQEFEATGLPWVLPSPNMPTPATARVYPGLCLVEGTNLSEGRGTTRPFELVGAPYLQGRELAASLAALALPGVAFRACSFTPTFQKHVGQSCGGVQLHVTDPRTFRPVETGVALLQTARQLAPTAFDWRAEAYEFVNDRPAIDLLAGSAWLRDAVQAATPLAELRSSWAAQNAAYREWRRPFLLYGGEDA